MKRKAPLKRKGGRRFPKAHDPKYWRWLGAVAHGACEVCGAWQSKLERAHLIPRSRGGGDRNNVVLLCCLCHQASEKRVKAFGKERGVDLLARAKALTAYYLQETKDLYMTQLPDSDNSIV